MYYQKILADFAKRRQEIKALRAKDPGKWTWKAIADKYSISPQRAQKIGAGK